MVTTKIPSDKSVRTVLHHDIRRIFKGRIESSTDTDKQVMTFSAALPISRGSDRQGLHGTHPRQRNKVSWQQRGGDFLHFSMYKENKDTMEVVSYLARQMQVNAKAFQFAGTKDRRAVTVQRVSVYRAEESRLARQNHSLRNAALGDFQYQKSGLELGDLKGNEFVVTLRDCGFQHAEGYTIEERQDLIRETVVTACQNLHQKGFFNYYGLQRFGTFSTRTDAVGVKLLQGDFQGACNAILDYNPDALRAARDSNSTAAIGSDDKARAEAISLFREGSQVNESLGKLPRKFSAEACIIRHLGKHKTDYLGAVQSIPRNLRLMYVHAYQSLVWNFALGERWQLFGDKVVEGDLVLVKEHRLDEPKPYDHTDTVDEDGEPVIVPQTDDRATAVDDMFERARTLTAEEASSGKYTLSDIVLPLPGFDVLYPANAMTDFYKDFMGSDRRGGGGKNSEGDKAGGGLDPFDMRRKQKDLSLSGSYRKIVAKIGDAYEVQVRAYQDENEQFVETDLDKIKGRPQASGSASATTTTTSTTAISYHEQPQKDHSGSNNLSGDEQATPASKVAIIIKLQLGPSQYATMALRELSKGGIQAYKPDFGGGR